MMERTGIILLYQEKVVVDWRCMTDLIFITDDHNRRVIVSVAAIRSITSNSKDSGCTIRLAPGSLPEGFSETRDALVVNRTLAEITDSLTLTHLPKAS